MSMDEYASYENDRLEIQADCMECGRPYSTTFTEHTDTYDYRSITYQDLDEEYCDFCLGEATCRGKLRDLDGQLNQYGKTKTERVPCKKEATVLNTEDDEVYCDTCWIYMCSGEVEEAEEFVIRRTE